MTKKILENTIEAVRQLGGGPVTTAQVKKKIKEIDSNDDGYVFRWKLSQSGFFDKDLVLSTPKKAFWGLK